MKKTNYSEVRRILFLTLLVDVMLVIVAYYINPIIFNYPPYSLDVEFQNSVLPLTYNQQFVSIFGSSILLLFFWSIFLLKPVIDFQKSMRQGKQFTQQYIDKIRSVCMKCPYKMLALRIILPTFLLLAFLVVAKVPLELMYKMILVEFLFLASIGMYEYIITKKYYDKIISQTYEITKEYKFNKKEFISMRALLFFQITTLFVIGIIIAILLGYTRVVNEKGNSMYYYYSSEFNLDELENNEITLEELKEKLQSVKLSNEDDFYFIIFPNNYEYKSREDKELSDFFKIYMKENYEKTKGRVYEFYGVEEQAFVRKVVDKNGGVWYAGFKYKVSAPESLYFLTISAIIIMLIYILIIYVWAKNTSLNISRIGRNLNDIIANNRVDLDDVMPITSNDELGSLADAYNRMQKLLSGQVELMEKQAQLATLGELAGGMAHDINTPIASIDNSLAMLKEVTKVQDKVDSKDILMVVSIMEKCVNRITTIVNSMRNQIRNLGSQEKVVLNLKNVVEDSIVIIGNDMLKNGCKVKTSLQDVFINGEQNKIGQVITNLAVNAMQAYVDNKRTGEIIIKTYKTETEAIIEVQDFAGGIPESIRPYIFKNILTTKGIEGTGLGLYLAYSIVKGIYGGTITFEVDEGKGTTFIIRLPLTEEKREEE